MKTHKPPQSVAVAAARALKWISEGKAGKGMTMVGKIRANQLAKRMRLTEETIKRMRSFFARHEVDKQAEGFSQGEKGFPTPGRVSWDAWGGDAGQTWVNALKLESDK